MFFVRWVAFVLTLATLGRISESSNLAEKTPELADLQSAHQYATDVSQQTPHPQDDPAVCRSRREAQSSARTLSLLSYPGRRQYELLKRGPLINAGIRYVGIGKRIPEAGERNEMQQWHSVMPEEHDKRAAKNHVGVSDRVQGIERRLDDKRVAAARRAASVEPWRFFDTTRMIKKFSQSAPGSNRLPDSSVRLHDDVDSIGSRRFVYPTGDDGAANIDDDAEKLKHTESDVIGQLSPAELELLRRSGAILDAELKTALGRLERHGAFTRKRGRRGNPTRKNPAIRHLFDPTFNMMGIGR